jgi:hypothetical protein
MARVAFRFEPSGEELGAVVITGVRIDRVVLSPREFGHWLRDNGGGDWTAVLEISSRLSPSAEDLLA